MVKSVNIATTNSTQHQHFYRKNNLRSACLFRMLTRYRNQT